MVEIIVQYFQGCPNSNELLYRVKEAIKDVENIVYIEVLVESEQDARKIGFRGSPTLLINSQDFEGLPVPSKSSLSCRVYSKGLPTVEQIRERINSLLVEGK